MWGRMYNKRFHSVHLFTSNSSQVCNNENIDPSEIITGDDRLYCRLPGFPGAPGIVDTPHCKMVPN